MPRSRLSHQIHGREGAGNGAGAEEEEDIPVVCHSLPQIPDSPRNGLGNAGGPGLCWGLDAAESGEFLEFRQDAPWSGGPSICHLFHGCVLESGWMQPLSTPQIFPLVLFLFLFVPIYFPISNISFRAL